MSCLHLLDTDISSYLIKGRSASLEEKLYQIPPDLVCISVITKAELLYGLKRLPKDHLLHNAVHQYLKIVRTLPWEPDAAAYYADIRHQLTQSGNPIGEMDMMIAAHALSVGAVLVTNNIRHFTRIHLPLNLVNWLSDAN